MKNSDVAAGFVSLFIYGRAKRPLNGSSCCVHGHVFFSEERPIAIYDSGKFYLSKERISPATSRNQNALRKAITEDGATLVEVNTFHDAVSIIDSKNKDILAKLEGI